MNKKDFTKKFKVTRLEGGMTYVELIVVISIMGIMTAVVIPNYSTLQKKIEVKNIANEIALKVVEAQKRSTSGQLPDATHQSHISVSPWHPSYGVYFNRTADSKKFVYYADLDNQGFCDSSCDSYSISDPYYDYIDSFNITSDKYIKKIQMFPQSDPTNPTEVDKLTITFARPDSSAIFASSIPSGDQIGVKTGVFYVEITVSSLQDSLDNVIRVYQSGRIQIK